MKVIGDKKWEMPRKVYEVVLEDDCYHVRVFKRDKDEYVWRNTRILQEDIVFPNMQEDAYYINLDEALAFIEQKEGYRNETTI